MNRLTNLTTAISIGFALLLLGYLLSAPHSASAAFSEFPVGHSRTVYFDAQKEALETATQRERLDQLRDWLLFTTVSASGLSSEQINQSVFDLPAIRRGYMQKVANFNYGETRSSYLGDGQVVALLPPGSADERAAHLAHIADEQRKNQGAIPDTIMVFEYRVDADPSLEGVNGSLTRLESISGGELFTEKYGYFERGIKSLEDLRQFMERVDDVTYARTDGDLVLGGRRMPGRPYRGIRVEDVAAIWQSEARIQVALGLQEKRVKEFNDRWSSRTYRNQVERYTLLQQRDREWEQLKQSLQADAKQNKLAAGSGFSLDPTFDFDGLKKEFDGKLSKTIRLLLDDGSGAPVFNNMFQGGRFVNNSPDSLIERASNGLGKRDIGPFMELLNYIEQHKTPLARRVEKIHFQGKVGLSEGLLNELNQRHGFQSARYDGNLQGTEVGMVLFYTDLMAKLWSFDFKDSAPQKEIKGFIPDTSLPVSNVYKEELERLNQTRLWFGPQAKGFQVADAGNSMLFARTATRIFAASATALRPEAESQTNALSGPLMDWWDDHYEEIARYEPEYERLNEIMKWSLLISWLNERNRSRELDFLKSVEVDRSNWFPDWARKRDLRFRQWEQVGFYDRGHKGSDTEALPLLRSDSFNLFGKTMYMEGGVSLADKSLFAGRAALSAETKVAGLARRSNLNYGMSKVAGEAVSFEGTAYKFTSLSPNRASMTVAAKDGVKLRSAHSEVASLKLERVVAQEANSLKVSTRLGEIEMGGLEIGRAGNAFQVGWRSRDVDLGHSLARRLSVADDPGKTLLADANVEAVIKLGEQQGHLVKLRGSDRWLQLSPEKAATGNGNNWQSRVGGFSNESRIYEMAWKKPEEIQLVFSASDDIIVEPVKGAERGFQMKAAPGGHSAAGSELEFKSGSVIVKGRLHPETGEVRFAYGELPETFRRDPLKLQRLVAESRVTPERSRYVVSELADGHPLIQRLRRGDAGDLVKELLDSPTEFKSRLGHELAEGVAQSDHLLSKGQYQEAARHLDELISVYGERPELLLRRGAAKLSNKFPDASGSIREMLAAGRGNDPALFFKEINERLRVSGAMPGGATVVREGGDVALHCRIDSLAGKVTVSPAELQQSGRVLVYVQDSPHLNNLDWSVSVHQTLNEAVSGNLGTVVRLPRGDIAKLRPTRIFMPDGVTSYHAVNEAGTNFGFRYPRYYYGPNFQDDDEEEEDERPQEDIFLLLAARN